MKRLTDWMAKNKWMVLILILAFFMASWPSFVFNLPITQTDGATYYVYSRLFADNLKLNVPTPAYNVMGSAETNINQYPPFQIVALGLVLRAFDSHQFWLNGFYGSIFFVLAALFFYLLSRKMFNSELAALMASLLFILNVRAYYTLHTGMYATFISFCFTIPVLYFFYNYMDEKKVSDMAWALVFFILTLLTYPVQALFALVLLSALFIAFMLKGKIRIKGIDLIEFTKKIELRKEIGGLIFFLLALISTAIVLKLFVFVPGHARSSWVSQWISNLLSPCEGYQCVWKYLIITDGPIIFIFSIIGMIYSFFKERLDIFLLSLFGWFIVLFKFFAVEGQVVINFYLHRFYTTFFILMILSFVYLIYSLMMNKKAFVIALFLFLACLLIQIVKLGFFFSMVSPAISQQEYDVSMFMGNAVPHESANALYVDNAAIKNQFREFKWVFVNSKMDKYEIKDALPEDISAFDYIFISDTGSLSGMQTSRITSGFSEINREGSVALYRKIIH